LQRSSQEPVERNIPMNDSTSRNTIQERFQQFHTDNPWIFKKLLSMTTDLMRKGKSKCGIKMLWEVLRWEVEIGTITVGKDFKLNNNYTSRYARMISDHHPMYAKIFSLRDLRSL